LSQPEGRRDEVGLSGKPEQTEYAPFYAEYVSLVPEDDVLAALEAQPGELRALLAAVPAERETHRYEPGKWSLREVVGHLTDGERVFGYRAFCISRGEQVSLPAFDENEYVARSAYHGQRLADLVNEFATVRDANLRFLRRLDGQGWRQAGVANENLVSVRALAFIMVGHVRHHIGVVRGRYGVQ
jgi:DinB family protein